MVRVSDAGRDADNLTPPDDIAADGDVTPGVEISAAAEVGDVGV